MMPEQQKHRDQAMRQSRQPMSVGLRVKAFIKEHNLLDSNELYIVALSGGADSVALLLLLVEQGYRVEAAHCNFHLRGHESDRDEQFCISLCGQLGIPLHRIHFDTKTYAGLHKLSIEMAARELRYRYFEQLRSDIGAAGICVAHHKDDSVETIMMNLLRGTGLRGLCGIRPRNGFVVRVLLCVTRQEIETYLHEKGQPYVTDSTNLQADVLRNKIRLEVMPLLKELNPAVADNILRTADNVNEAQKVLDAAIQPYRDVKELKISELKKQCSSEYIIYEWLRNYGFNGRQVRQIIKAETGRIFSSGEGYEALVDRGRIIVERAMRPFPPMRIPECGTYVGGDGGDAGFSEELHVKIEKHTMEPHFLPSREALHATLDAETVSFPLTIRRVEQGDRMMPYGMKGKRLVSDVMTDRKMSLFEKRRQLAVADAEGKIVWLVGLRTDHRCRVTSHTRQVLSIKILR